MFCWECDESYERSTIWNDRRSIYTEKITETFTEAAFETYPSSYIKNQDQTNKQKNLFFFFFLVEKSFIKKIKEFIWGRAFNAQKSYSGIKCFSMVLAYGWSCSVGSFSYSVLIEISIKLSLLEIHS